MICRDEEVNLRACVESFKGAYDELIIVDTGSTDKTVEIARDLGAKVVQMVWKDDFAEARNQSFDSASGDWLIWAEPDERLEAGHAEKIRQLLGQTQFDVIRVTLLVNEQLPVMRERFVRRGAARWARKVHEKIVCKPEAKLADVAGIVVKHPSIKESSHGRNIGMLRASLKDAPLDLFYLATEMHAAGNKDDAVRLARVALATRRIDEIQQYELLLNLACDVEDQEERTKYFLDAYRVMPYRREALACLCRQALDQGKDLVAFGYAKAMMGLQKPPFPIWTLNHKLYGWGGLDLYAYVMRRNGWDKGAEEVLQKARNGQLPHISLIHASRGRPEKMVETRNLFFERSALPHMIEHVFILDADDYRSIEAAKGYAHQVIHPGGGCVAAWNHGAKFAAGRLLVQLSDDWIPPQGWDNLLIDQVKNVEPMDERVIAVSDGIDRGGGVQTKCLCMAIMTRGRWSAQGHMFHPSYKSVFSDNEFTDRAYEDGVVIEARDITFQHVHPLTGKVPMDPTYQASNAPERYKEGERNYLIRKSRRQGKKATDRDYAAFILTTGENFCLGETIDRLKEDGVKQVYLGFPNQFWSGKRVNNFPDETKIVQAWRESSVGNESKFILLDVEKHRAPGRHILDTEARVRNEALEIIRRDGWQHIVIADDDELWLPGTLMEIDNYVSDNFPESLCLRMIPVIGVPGYPVEGAQDVAMVYLGPSGKFSWSRSSAGKQHIVPRRKVIHFSATRKTLAEVIEKSRASGHYTDPDYDFEGWIAKILPNIEPGMKDVHMYRKWSTWPLVREWTEAEWSAIPDSIKPYLGEPSCNLKPSASQPIDARVVGVVSGTPEPPDSSNAEESRTANSTGENSMDQKSSSNSCPNPETPKKYSQNDEEKFILEFFKDEGAGRFLDIGAYDGKTFSNTRALIERGWSGVMVEPSPRCFVKLMAEYKDNPNITLVNALVGTVPGLMLFHDSLGANATADDAHYQTWKKDQRDYQTIYLPVLRLNPLCKLAGKVDFVNIDTEGMDWDILQALPVEDLGVRLICIEYGSRAKEMVKWFDDRGWQNVMHNMENMIWRKP